MRLDRYETLFGQNLERLSHRDMAHAKTCRYGVLPQGRARRQFGAQNIAPEPLCDPGALGSSQFSVHNILYIRYGTRRPPKAGRRPGMARAGGSGLRAYRAARAVATRRLG